MTFLARLGRTPQRFDFHQTLRRLENLFRHSPRWGTAARPSDEPIRLGQDPSLAFGASSLTAFSPPNEAGPGRLDVAFFGLFGPHGPLPLHLTEYARERIRHAGDHTFAGFVNLFNHRMLVLFHRAWAAAQPVVSLDRPETDRFQAYLAALFGHDFAQQAAGAESTRSKLQYAAYFAGQSRNAAGLRSLIAHHFGLPTRIEEFVGTWLEIPDRSRLRLGISAEVSTLGRTAILGNRVWRCDQKFRIVLGPISSAQLERLLPGGSALPRLTDMVRAYTCGELDWDVRLELAENETNRAQLHRGSRLAWNARLGSRAAGNSEHLIVHPSSGRTERSVAA